jgi:hypothetical protein
LRAVRSVLSHEKKLSIAALSQRFDHSAIYFLIAGTYTPFLAQTHCYATLKRQKALLNCPFEFLRPKEAIEERRWLRSLVQSFAKTGTGQ